MDNHKDLQAAAGECSSHKLLLMAAGELPPEGFAAIESHLADCPACRDELRMLRASLGDLEQLNSPPMSDQATARIRLVARQALWPRRQMHVRRAAQRLTRRLTYAAAAVLAVALVWSVFITPTSEVPATGPVPSTPNVAANVDANVDAADPGRAVYLANQTDRSLFETSVIGEVLVEGYEGDEWSEATRVVLARLDQDTLINELMTLEMELQWMEQVE